MKLQFELEEPRPPRGWEPLGLESSHIHFQIPVLDTVPLTFRERKPFVFQITPTQAHPCEWLYDSPPGLIQMEVEDGKWGKPSAAPAAARLSPEFICLPSSKGTPWLKKTDCLKIANFPRASQIPCGKPSPQSEMSPRPAPVVKLLTAAGKTES